METGDASTYDIFVSYSSKQADYAHALVDRLEKGGIRCWIAPRDILPGKEYPSEIARGLREAKALVLLLSHSAQSSRFVRAEIERAMHLDHAIFWLRLEDIEPEGGMAYLLSLSQGIDAVRGSRDEHWSRLADAISETPPPPEPTGEKAILAHEVLPSSLFNSWRTRLIRIALYTIVGWLLLAFDPLGVSSATQRAGERVMANILAPYYGSGVFRSGDVPSDTVPVDWNEHITVLLLEDSALEEHGLSWPVSYAFHADVIEDLYETYRPSAIMVDLLFLDRRPGQEAALERLSSVLRRIRDEGETKIYLAADDEDPPQSGILTELRNAAVLLPVSWPKLGNVTDDSHRYPVENGAGFAPFTDDGPAYVIYRDLCQSAEGPVKLAMACTEDGIDGRDFTEQMLLFWGASAPPLNWEQANLGQRFACRRTKGSLPERVGAYTAFAVTGESELFPQKCPYPQMILVRDFVDSRFRQLSDVRAAYRQALSVDPESKRPKVVFYGADLRGLDDKIVSYTHHRIAGVFAHAMALDNFMTLGSDYVRFGRKTLIQDPHNVTHLFNAVLAFVLATVCVLLTELRILVYKPGTSLLRRIYLKVIRSPVGPVLLTAVNLAVVLPVLTAASYVGYVELSIAPANWAGFLLLVVGIRLAETRRIENVVTKFLSGSQIR